MENNHYIDLLRRYYKNQLSPEEIIELFDWINSIEGEETYNYYLTTQLTSIEKDKLIPYTGNIDKLLQQIHTKAHIRQHYPVFFSNWAKYAAIIILFITLSTSLFIIKNNGWNHSNELVYAVSKGSKSTVQLADGSEVWLNSESKMSLTGNQNRKISLEGEAYLEIAKDKKRKFIVSTPYLDIIVYGTAFNISSYPADSMVYVSLVAGSIGLQPAGDKNITVMAPGQFASFDIRNKSIHIQEKDLTDIALWRQAEMQLKDVDISTLYKKLESWYGIHINLIDVPDKKHLYNLSIRYETIEEIMELINMVSPVDYNIYGKEVYISYN